ncbi:polysaccharide biosynthesis C-terminal domain-containing protein [Eubacterium limosum]|jgi:O-antigen/teichoic acid export membrane protein|uniref:Polysaccharide biosynthesis protein n=1 Tax=Eubacterium limosum TaxID=1736 RepID=A0AAC9QT61_EUBLI|nr:polysaccharide biosynthesis C-terminal domain-containing protein [Eubacterium limosum]ARD65235.1 hypothetical protein B2M23_06635 [Eubacterium limosum]PWW49664.1 O-antigen/teichoic acid export membrane protein [Eubacterium limosum]UQZ20733.1 polysaccharide biosynthesis C-terminal domain-containing protein [Eubacterium limosum]
MKTILKVFSADMAAKFVAMITTILLIRYMSDHNYADYTIFVASTNIFNQIAISSFGKMYIVDHASLKGKESTLLSIEMSLSIFITGMFWIIQPVVRSNVFALVLLMISTCVFGYARVIYQQQCKFKVYTILEIIRVASFLALVFTCHYFAKTELSAFVVIIFQTISLALCIPFLSQRRTNITIFQKLDFKSLFKFLLQKEQLYLFVYAALMAILLQIDVLALKTWSTDYDVSTYASAFKYYNMMLLLLNTVNSVLLPKISSEENYYNISKMYKQQDILSIALLVGIVIAIVIAPCVLPIIDGGKYPEAIGVFRILCISAIISFWGSPYNNLLIKEKKYLSICTRFIIGIIVAIAGNYILIPRMGVNGTAISTLISYGIVNLSSRVHAKMIIKEKIRG